jgi:hypothetical protein
MTSRPASGPGSGALDLAALLGDATSEGPAARVAALVAAALWARPDAPCRGYLRAMQAALGDEPPPFGAVLYAEMQAEAARSGQWVVVALLDKALDVASRARSTWSQAVRGEPAERTLLARHAVADSDRVHAYLGLLDQWFPGALDAGFRAQLDELSPRYELDRLPAAGGAPPDLVTVDELVRLHLADLRAAFQHGLWQAALAAHCPPERAAAARRQLADLLRGELDDIAQLAALIEQRAGTGEPAELRAVLARGLRRFVRDTAEQPLDFTYHQRFGTYP